MLENNAGLHIVFNDYISNYDDLLTKAKIKKLSDDRLHSLMIEVFKARKGLSPAYIADMFLPNQNGYDLTRSDPLAITHKRTTKYGLKSFKHHGASIWNRLPNYLKDADDISFFRREIKSLDLTKFILSKTTNS